MRGASARSIVARSGSEDLDDRRVAVASEQQREVVDGRWRGVVWRRLDAADTGLERGDERHIEPRPRARAHPTTVAGAAAVTSSAGEQRAAQRVQAMRARSRPSASCGQHHRARCAGGRRARWPTPPVRSHPPPRRTTRRQAGERPCGGAGAVADQHAPPAALGHGLVAAGGEPAGAHGDHRQHPSQVRARLPRALLRPPRRARAEAPRSRRPARR